jgi:hypothetical protein
VKFVAALLLLAAIYAAADRIDRTDPTLARSYSGAR